MLFTFGKIMNASVRESVTLKQTQFTFIYTLVFYVYSVLHTWLLYDLVSYYRLQVRQTFFSKEKKTDFTTGLDLNECLAEIQLLVKCERFDT